MNFKSEISEFRNVLESVIRASQPNSPVPIFSQVKIETRDGLALLSCTNDNIEIGGSCDAEVKTHGSVCVTAKKLLSLLTGSGEFTFEGDTLKRDRCTYRLPVVGGDQYPSFPEANGNEFRVNGGELQGALETCSVALAKVGVLSGVHFAVAPNHLTLTATNTHQLIQIRLLLEGWPNAESEFSFTLPGEAARELAHLPVATEWELRVSESCLFAEEGYRFAARLLSGNYPVSLAAKVAERPVTGGLMTEREPLVAALKRLQAISAEDLNRVYLSLQNGTLSFAARAGDLGSGEEQLPCGADLDAATAILHGGQFLSMLGACGRERVALGFEGEGRPVHLYSLGDMGFHGVLMPLAGGA